MRLLRTLALGASLLALVRLPDFTTPLNRIADSLEAGSAPGSPPSQTPAPAAQRTSADADPHATDLPEPR